MPKLASSHVPSYRLHKCSGQALVTLNGRDICLGKHGSPASREKYDRLIAEWLASGRQVAGDHADARSIADLVVAFREYARVYYRLPDGSPSTELATLDQALAPLVKLYAHTPAGEFGPLKLKAVRSEMIDRGWCRRYINQQISRLRHVFKWATENELIQPHVHHSLQAVSGLRQGRSAARESDPVCPVAEAHVEAVLPLVSPQVATMIRLQLLTGMRPGEVCGMRRCDIDSTGDLWVYRPPHHKTAHHGHHREIYLGPRAQQLVRPYLKPDLEAHLFSPAEAEQQRRRAQHAARTTPLSCGNVPGSNRRAHPRRCPGDRYDVDSYRRAIARACDAADQRARSGQPNEERLIRRWHPHQLRHTAATRLRREYGLEAAQVILGHKTLTMTQICAEKHVQTARTVMARAG